MTVDVTDLSEEYIGNDSTPTYSHKIPAKTVDELLVTVTDTEGVTTSPAFTLVNPGTRSGGITLTAGNLPSGHKLSIKPSLAIEQVQPFGATRQFNGAAHEQMADRLTFISAQIQAGIVNGVRLSKGGDGDALLADNGLYKVLEPTVGSGGFVFKTANVDTLKLTDYQPQMLVQTREHTDDTNIGGKQYQIKTAIQVADAGDIIDGKGNHELANGFFAVMQKSGHEVSVASFGCVLDGVADDTESFVAALNSGSKRVIIPDGQLRLTSDVLIPVGVSLVGSGAGGGSNNPDGCKIIIDHNGTYGLKVGESVNDDPVGDSYFAEYSGFSLICNAGLTYGMHVQRCISCWFHDLWIIAQTPIASDFTAFRAGGAFYRNLVQAVHVQVAGAPHGGTIGRGYWIGNGRADVGNEFALTNHNTFIECSSLSFGVAFHNDCSNGTYLRDCNLEKVGVGGVTIKDTGGQYNIYDSCWIEASAGGSGVLLDEGDLLTITGTSGTVRNARKPSFVNCTRGFGPVVVNKADEAAFINTTITTSLTISIDANRTRFVDVEMSGVAITDNSTTTYMDTREPGTDDVVNTAGGKKFRWDGVNPRHETVSCSGAVALTPAVNSYMDYGYLNTTNGTVERWVGFNGTRVMTACQGGTYSATYAPPSVPAGGLVSTDVAVANSFTGDFVDVSHQRNGSGMIIYGQVVTNGTVRVYFHNPTASAIAITSGTLRVKISRID